MQDRRQHQKRNGKRHGDSANDELLQPPTRRDTSTGEMWKEI
jgi:hypothetical protein